MAITKRNSNVMLILQYLYKLVSVENLFISWYSINLIFSCKVFEEYFGELEEESIRDNFVIIYELLDETMDHGYPQTSEARILRE